MDVGAGWEELPGGGSGGHGFSGDSGKRRPRCAVTWKMKGKSGKKSRLQD